MNEFIKAVCRSFLDARCNMTVGIVGLGPINYYNHGIVVSEPFLGDMF